MSLFAFYECHLTLTSYFPQEVMFPSAMSNVKLHSEALVSTDTDDTRSSSVGSRRRTLVATITLFTRTNKKVLVVSLRMSGTSMILETFSRWPRWNAITASIAAIPCPAADVCGKLGAVVVFPLTTKLAMVQATEHAIKKRLKQIKINMNSEEKN